MKKIEKFKDLLKNSKNIIITTHIHPDADGLGSQIALALALQSKSHNVICINEDSMPSRYRYLDDQRVIKSAEEFKNLGKHDKIDLTLVIDANSLSRVGPRVSKIIEFSQDILFIDHHPTSKEIMKIHLIDTSKAATGEIIGRLILSVLKIELTYEMALALYTAILVDTSSFRYPNVSGDTHRLIGKLIDSGVNPPDAYNKVYGAKKISNMNLLGEILSNVKATDNETVAWIIIDDKMLNKYKVSSEDTHSFINYLLVLNNIKVACMFRAFDGQVKISLRSSGEVDVSTMAQALGGGGHYHAAAAITKGPLASVVKNTIEKILLMISK
jgi:phosphoesterase RecJ-like protein